ITLQRLAWDRGPIGTRLQTLTGSVAMGDSVWLRLTALRTPELDVHGWANWVSGERTERRMHLEVERVRWSWLARAFQNDVFDVPGEGHGTIDATGSQDWRGQAAIEASWDSLPVVLRGDFLWKSGTLRVA